jgi:hypothetical protein
MPAFRLAVVPASHSAGIPAFRQDGMPENWRAVPMAFRHAIMMALWHYGTQ